MKGSFVSSVMLLYTHTHTRIRTHTYTCKQKLDHVVYYHTHTDRDQATNGWLFALIITICQKDIKKISYSINLGKLTGGHIDKNTHHITRSESKSERF